VSTADAIREQARLAIRLPDAGQIIEVRTYRVREMFETGMASRIMQFREDGDNAEDDAKKAMEDARRVLVACAYKPKIGFEESDRPGYVCINDITPDDVTYAFEQIIQVDDSRYYGANRTAFDPEENDALITAQMRISATVDGVCQRYGINPREVERWTDKEMARTLAMIEAAEYIRNVDKDKNG
jgi:hypothetical protein